MLTQNNSERPRQDPNDRVKKYHKEYKTMSDRGKILMEPFNLFLGKVKNLGVNDGSNRVKNVHWFAI